MGFMLATSDPWWVGNPFICHQWIPLQMWGHFLPRKRYSPASSNHQIGNLRDGCEMPQPKAAKPNIWDPATPFWTHPGCQKCDWSQGHSIQWALQGCNLSHMDLFTLKGHGPCCCNTGSDSHRVASYPTNLQTSKSHQCRVPKITLSMYR